MAVQFRIQHLDHAGGVISTHTPVGGTLDWNYKVNEVGTISYQLAMEELEGLSLPANSFAPYLTDFRLQMSVNGGAWSGLMGGIHVPVNLVNDQDAVNVAGRDWAHWLEQPVWFDLYSVDWDTLGSGIDYLLSDPDHFKITGATAGVVDKTQFGVLAFLNTCTQKTAVRTLIDTTKRGTDYVNINPIFNGNTASETLYVDPIVISFEDTTAVLQHINNISQLSDPYGFDWTIHVDKSMEFFGPRKIVEDAPAPIWTITDYSTLEQPAIDLDWTNNGPIGTHIVGLGIGSPALWHHKRDQQSVDKYREWLKLENVGDRYLKGWSIKHAVDGLQYIHPHKDIKLTILPEIINPSSPGDGFVNHVGDCVRIYWNFYPYHAVDAYFWITEQHFTSDPAGNFKCELGLQQIYGTTTLGG